MAVNKIFLLGRTGKDPEVKTIGDAKCAQFTLATSERYKDRNGEMQENTDWHNIVCWRQTADIVEKYVKKGSQLFIEGKVKYRSYETDRGEKRYVTDIVAERIELLGKPEGQQNPSPSPAPQQRVQTTPLPPAGEDDDTDLPF